MPLHFYWLFSKVQNEENPVNLDICFTTPVPQKFTWVSVSHKAAGLDDIPGHVLRACAAELSGVLTELFNLSLAHAVLPTCFKITSIVPVRKHSTPTCLNDYRPVVLTSIITKCFEQLVLAHLKSCLSWTPTNLPTARLGAQRIQSL